MWFLPLAVDESWVTMFGTVIDPDPWIPYLPSVHSGGLDMNLWEGCLLFWSQYDTAKEMTDQYSVRLPIKNQLIQSLPLLADPSLYVDFLSLK